MGSSKDDAEREYQREHCCEDDSCLDNYSTKELVSELRKRDGVEAIDVPVEGESQILVWDTARPANDVEGDTARYNGSDGGSAIILRITD